MAALLFVRPWLVGLASQASGGTSALEFAGQRFDVMVLPAYLVALLTWAVDRLAGARTVLSESSSDSGSAIALLDRHIGSTFGPVLLTIANVTVSLLLLMGGALPGLAIAVNLPLEALTTFPIMSFLWTLVVILLAIDRLGRQPLPGSAVAADRALGLRGVGEIAFFGFAVATAAFVPYVVGYGSNTVALLTALLLYAAAGLAFVLSVLRLHRRMVEVKTEQLTRARSLYAEAFAPLAASATLTTLAAQQSLLAAAEALEKRAESILEWPIEERTARWLALLFSGVVTGVIVRLVILGLQL